MDYYTARKRPNEPMYIASLFTGSNFDVDQFTTWLSRNQEQARDDQFSYDESGYVQVYVDGSCLGNGTPNAKAGIGVFWNDSHPLNVSQPATKATNNVAEIEAVAKAAEVAKSNQIRKLHVISDSKYVHDCLFNWMPNKWKLNGWKTSEGQPVKNRSELEHLESILSGLAIKWSHIESHSGNPGNDKADELAKLGAHQQ